MARRRTIGAAAALALVLAAGCIEFAPPTATPLTLASGQTVVDVVAGDFTGDGRSDALAGTASPVGSVQVHACGGTCLQPVPGPDGWLPQPGLVADYDGDGIDDAVLASGGVTRLFFGGAAGGGRPAGLTVDDSTALPTARSYQAGDYDGDGDVDLLVGVVQFTYYVQFTEWLNDGTGVLTASATTYFGGALNAGGGWAVVGDFDPTPGDEVLVQQATDPLMGLFVLAVGDIDGDGRDDLARRSGYDVVFRRSEGGSRFSNFPPYQALTTSGIDIRAELLDLDGDGLTDVAITDPGGPPIYRAGTADGGFPYEPLTDVPTGRAAFGDVDGDGVLDAVSVGSDGRSLEVWRSTAGDG